MRLVHWHILGLKKHPYPNKMDKGAFQFERNRRHFIPKIHPVERKLRGIKWQ